jgi:hypothetical protein
MTKDNEIGYKAQPYTISSLLPSANGLIIMMARFSHPTKKNKKQSI